MSDPLTWTDMQMVLLGVSILAFCLAVLVWSERRER